MTYQCSFVAAVALLSSYPKGVVCSRCALVFPLQSISEHAGVLLPLLREVALAQTMPTRTGEDAAKTYSAIINKQPDSEALCSMVTSDLEHVLTKIRDGGPEEKQKSVTTVLWVRRRF